MKLERIRIQQLPGVRPGFDLPVLDPGISLVVGPNGSGKSSLVRALRYLLAGIGPDDPLALSLEAEFESMGKQWIVIRTGSQIEWRQDGSPAEAPSFPDPRFLYCYWLTVEDLLLQEHEGDERIVARLRRELTGGYDVDGLLGQDGPFKVGTRHGVKESKALLSAQRKVRDVARRYQTLQKERERLPGLEDRIEKGAEINDRISGTERALELLQAQRTRIEAEAALDEFPAAPDEMARLRGDEGDRLDKLAGRRKGLDEEREEWQRNTVIAEDDLEATGLREKAPANEELELQRRTLQGVRDQLRDKRGAEKKHDEATARERIVAESLGVPWEARPALDPANISKAEKLADEIEGVRKKAQEFEARLEGATDPPDAADLEAHREAAGALRSWQGAAATGLGKLLPVGIVVLVGSLVSVIALIADLGGVALWAAVVATFGAVWVCFSALMAKNERNSARVRFEKAGLALPQDWTVPEVTKRLEEIDGRLSELKDADVRARRVERAREDLAEANEQLRLLEIEKQDLASEVGFDPEVTAKSVYEFVRLLDQVRTARTDAEEATAEIERIDVDIGERLRAVRSFLAIWGSQLGQEADGPQTEGLLANGASEIAVDTVETEIHGLSERCKKANDAKETIKRAAEDVLKLGGEIGRLDTEVAEIFEQAGLDPLDRAGLDVRLNSLEAFGKREEEVRNARIAEAQSRTRLREDEELLALVGADDEGGLRAALDELQRDADGLESWKREKTAIETRLEEADAGRQLEQSMAAVSRAQTDLEDAFDKALLAAAGRSLLEDVKDEHRIEHEPELFRDARERFERFTHQSWTLELAEDSGFAARDLVLDEQRKLSELSSGTRMQLLLAVRMAWAWTLEVGREPLPIFLDEALTTSDPERFAQVAKSLAVLAEEEGRQIVYLCAQPGDVQLWERALGKMPPVIDLAAVRSGGPPEAGPDSYALPDPESVPEPEGNTPEAYAALLGVPKLDPWEAPGAVHIFHLLRDDLGTLHGLMAEWRIVSLGQLEALLNSPAVEEAVPDPEVRTSLEARCRVSRHWLWAWRVGRGRPVDRGVLEQSGAISENFIDRVSERAAELSGDPDALLRELPNIPRLQTAKIHQLEVWLEEQGYLSPEERLDRGKREARVLQEAAGLLDHRHVQEVIHWLEGAIGDRC